MLFILSVKRDIYFFTIQPGILPKATYTGYLQKLNYFITIEKIFPLTYKFKLYMKKNKCMVFHTDNKILTAVNQMQNK